MHLTEQSIAEMAPNDKALVDGRGLVKKGALKKLAKNDRFSDGALIQIGEVFAPIWLTYVSRAEQLIADRSVLGK